MRASRPPSAALEEADEVGAVQVALRREDRGDDRVEGEAARQVRQQPGPARAARVGKRGAGAEGEDERRDRRRSDEAKAKAEDNGENRERGLNSKIFDTYHFAAVLEERRASERHKEKA